jgi:hypothetical protein
VQVVELALNKQPFAGPAATSEVFPPPNLTKSCPLDFAISPYIQSGNETNVQLKEEKWICG